MRCFIIQFLLSTFLIFQARAEAWQQDFVDTHNLDCKSEQECFDKYFLFQGKPVDLRLIYLLKGHFQRQKMSIASVFLDGELNRSRFFEPAQHEWALDEDDRATAKLYFNRENSGIFGWRDLKDEAYSSQYWFEYTYIGKSEKGILVVLADEQFGGETNLPVLLFLKTRQVSMQIDGEVVTLTALDLVGNMRIGVPIWPRTHYHVNDILLDKNKVIILPDSWGTEAGPGPKMEIDLLRFQ